MPNYILFNKSIIATAFLLFFTTADATIKDSNYSSLYKQRPAVIREKIDRTFKTVSTRTQAWPKNGESKYHICAIDDEKFILEIIAQSPKQKEFYFMDVGAGAYQWANNVLHILRNNPNVPKNKKYHIIGLNGEGKDKIENIENCTIYKLGSFEIENITETFLERGMNLNGKIDFIISRWTLIHLVDPLGTLLQIMQLTKNDGYILFDKIKFPLLDTNRELISDNIDSNLNIHHLLLRLKQPHLVCTLPKKTDGGTSGILLQKTFVEPNTNIGLSYANSLEFARFNNAKFISKEPSKPRREEDIFNHYGFYGDRSIYDMLKEKKLLMHCDKNNLFCIYTLHDYYYTLNFYGKSIF